jgi:hypothetical protein
MSNKVAFACASVAALSLLIQRVAAQDAPPLHPEPWPIYNGFNRQPAQNDLRAFHHQDVAPYKAREIDRFCDQLRSSSEKDSASLGRPADGAAVDRLRATVKNASIGAIHNCQPCRPATEKPEDRVAAETLDAYWNLAFPDPQLWGVYPPAIAGLMTPYLKPDDLKNVCRPVDWFGLNHYSPHYVVASDNNPLGLWFGPAPADVPRTTMGWPVEPDAFREILTTMHKPSSARSWRGGF